MLLRLLGLAVLVHVTTAFPPVSPKRYDGHKVLEILHNTEEDFKKLLELEVKFELDFWKLPRHANDTLLVNVAPQYLQEVLSHLQAYNLRVSTFIDDVQKLIDETPSRVHQNHDKRAMSRRGSGFSLNVYHTYASIENYLNGLAHSSLPNNIVATTHSIGTSYEGRHIQMIKLHSTDNNGVPKKSILLDGGIHAREWIAPATIVYFIEHLIYNPGHDPAITAIMRSFDIYLIPVLNPDGYEYTDVVRLWRKNRAIHSTSQCVGTDLNRNFPFHWNPAVGGSTDPCSDIYSGPGAESEPETLALTRFLGAHPTHPTFQAYLTVHSYGQMWLYPWGYTSALPADWQDLHRTGRIATRALRSVHGTKYQVGSATRTLYAAAGGSDDFAKGTSGVKYSYTVELRDTGRYGFALPASYIGPVGEETLQGFLAFAKHIDV